jgi:hypothetical protein
LRRKLSALEERVEMLEVKTAEGHLQILDVAEKVAAKLEERVRKRKQPDHGPYDRLTPQEKGAMLRERGS